MAAAITLKTSHLQRMPRLSELITREEKNHIRLDLLLQDLIRRDTLRDSKNVRVKSLPRNDPFIWDLAHRNTLRDSSVSPNEMQTIISLCELYCKLHRSNWKGNAINDQLISLLLSLEISAQLELLRATRLHPIGNESQFIDSKVDCCIVKSIAMYHTRRHMPALYSKGETSALSSLASISGSTSSVDGNGRCHIPLLVDSSQRSQQGTSTFIIYSIDALSLEESNQLSIDTIKNNVPGFNDIVASSSPFASKGDASYITVGPAINLIVAYTSPFEGAYYTMTCNDNLPSDFSRRLIVEFNCLVNVAVGISAIPNTSENSISICRQHNLIVVASNADCLIPIEGEKTAKSKPHLLVCEREETAKSKPHSLLADAHTSLHEGEETAKSKPQFALPGIMSVCRVRRNSEGDSLLVQYQHNILWIVTSIGTSFASSISNSYTISSEGEYSINSTVDLSQSSESIVVPTMDIKMHTPVHKGIHSDEQANREQLGISVSRDRSKYNIEDETSSSTNYAHQQDSCHPQYAINATSKASALKGEIATDAAATIYISSLSTVAKDAESEAAAATPHTTRCRDRYTEQGGSSSSNHVRTYIILCTM